MSAKRVRTEKQNLVLTCTYYDNRQVEDRLAVGWLSKRIV